MTQSNDKNYSVLRATEEWQRAGAYSVRIMGMNRQHHIPLEEEIDDHDGEGTWYIVLLDDGFPVATCRFYPNGESTVMLGRVVVLPEYRGQNLGSRVVLEAEKWIREMGFETITIESRTEVVPFYEKLGYIRQNNLIYQNSVFSCTFMKKEL